MMDIRSRFGSRTTWVAGLLVASFVFLVSAAPASAFDIPTFSVTPSTTQAGGHPNVTVQIDRTGTDNEDIRDLYLDLPPGLIGNTTAVGSCTDAQFNSDTCPANSQVGSVSAVAVATGLSLPPTPGSIYNLVPGPTEPGAIGIVLRPMGAPAISPVFIRGSIEVAPDGETDVHLRNVVLNQPRQVFVLGVIPVDITVNSLTLTLNGAGTLGPGTYFLTNPTSCQVATSKARVVSYLDQEVNKESSYTPTGCDAVPFDPFFSVDFNPTTRNEHTAPTTIVGVPADQDPLSQSHVKSTAIRFVFNQVDLDFLLAASVGACSDADLAADTCNPVERLGDVTATVPVLDPPTFTGELYLTYRGLFAVAAVIRGPRGVRTVVHGQSELGCCPAYIELVFPSQPQVPLTSLEVELVRKIYVNRPTCGRKTITAHLVGHSGAERDLSDYYVVDGCEYARPKAASPTTVRLVPAYEQCTSSNASHGAPLASPSCSPPTPTSDHLTIGTPDTNGKPAVSTGSLGLKVVGEGPINPDNGDQADVEITSSLSDVRNQDDLSDYTGELRAVLGLRITDRFNPVDAPATVVDYPFAFNIPCSETTGPEGGACNLTTTADGLLAGVAVEGQRAIWELSQVQVFDGGADGDADTADNSLFAVQGTFAP